MLATASQIDGYEVSTNDPLIVAARQGFEQFLPALAESVQQGRIQGWQVGKAVGSTVGMLAGGVSLGSLGFVAGGAAGFSAGALLGAASIVPSATLFCTLIPATCPYMAVTAVVGSGIGAAHGGIAGATAGGYAGLRFGAYGGAKVGGLIGGAIGQEIGGTINALKSVHGYLFQLTNGLVLAIEYAAGDRGQ